MYQPWTESGPCAVWHNADENSADLHILHMLITFDSLSHTAWWLLLARCAIPQQIISLIQVLYDDGSTGCVRVGNQLSPWFLIASGLHQGCVIVPDFFAASMDWL